MSTLKNLKKILIILTFIASALPGFSQDSLLRYGLFVGANNGGSGRDALRYSNSDASALSSVMQELGGLSPQDTQSLTDPTSARVLETLKNFSKKIRDVHTQAKRVEFIFYYSGHSDEEGLLLAQEKLTYPVLRDALNDLNADVRIAILDSCSSGAFTRLKGGIKAAPFLVDASSVLKGHAYLTSSSENEASQESDRIGGSFFTYYLISGLRGAADTTGDGRVTLNEIYQHAFKETLARTENTLAGPQHPSYDIQLSGTGDLVLTDINVQSSRLVLSNELQGRVYVRTAGGQLMAEVDKKAGEQTPLALGAGDYVISLQNQTQYLTGRQTLAEGDVKILTSRDLKPSGREINRTRGDPIVQEAGTDLVSMDESTNTITIALPHLPKIAFLPFFNPEDPAEEQLPSQIQAYDFNLGLVPGLELHPGFNKSVKMSAHGLISQTAETTGFQVAGLLNFSGRLTGFQASGIGNVNTGTLEGFQASGIFNLAGNNAKGFQSAGIFNIVPREMNGFQSSGIFNIVGASLKGFQGAGIFNITGGNLEGFQGAGIFNISGDLSGFQSAGIFNISGSLKGFQTAGILNVAEDLNGFQVGLINKSAQLQGLQLGLVNISAHVDGLALGLITISDNAIHRVHYTSDTLGYRWNSYQWGANGFYTALSLGLPSEEYLKSTRNLIRGFSLGKIWGDATWLGLETGMYFLPEQAGLINPWNMAETAGHYVGTRGSLGVKWNFFTFYAGYGINLDFPGWSTSSPMTLGGSFRWPDSSYDIGYKTYWFTGASVGF